METTQDYLKTALSASLEGGKIFAQFFGRAGKVTIKNGNPRDLVTKVDKKIEQLIRKKISKNFPTHKIVGEEFKNPKLGSNDLVWFIDPVDGTANFIHGLPFCCISLALWDKHGPLVAVLHNPVIKQTFTAMRGQGAFLNGKKIAVSKQASLANAFGGYGWGRNVARAGQTFPILIKELNKIRTVGTTAMELAFVASGIYDFHIQAEIKIWDFAAGALILQEAGGKITDWHGRPITIETTQLVASNGKTHQQLMTIIKKLTPKT